MRICNRHERHVRIIYTRYSRTSRKLVASRASLRRDEETSGGGSDGDDEKHMPVGRKYNRKERIDKRVYVHACVYVKLAINGYVIRSIERCKPICRIVGLWSYYGLWPATHRVKDVLPSFVYSDTSLFVNRTPIIILIITYNNNSLVWFFLRLLMLFPAICVKTLARNTCFPCSLFRSHFLPLPHSGTQSNIRFRVESSLITRAQSGVFFDRRKYNFAAVNANWTSEMKFFARSPDAFNCTNSR